MYLERKRIRAEEQEIDNDKGVETLSQASSLGYVRRGRLKRRAT